ncbi:hypothetical protein M8C21_009369 [Ambrosia artemisiifolia]|uniref:Uncharacterized protein n=1 Tax=Ambrosia artemisiifolia TaxID=4212 RepID=A0AAD5CG57_AMBAR|nr:hypothetical protein M8C21_009369 [Ambrosia artemisiifolia]
MVLTVVDGLNSGGSGVVLLHHSSVSAASISLVGYLPEISIYTEGFRYDDLYDPMESLDIKEALTRLPREIVDVRNQWLLRAMDLSMKHEYLSKDLQAQQTPFRNFSYTLTNKPLCLTQ